MSKTKGATNNGDLQKDVILKFRCSAAFANEVNKALENQMFGSDKKISTFLRSAIRKHILYSAKDLTVIDRTSLDS